MLSQTSLEWPTPCVDRGFWPCTAGKSARLFQVACSSCLPASSHDIVDTGASWEIELHQGGHPQPHRMPVEAGNVLPQVFFAGAAQKLPDGAAGLAYRHCSPIPPGLPSPPTAALPPRADRQPPPAQKWMRQSSVGFRRLMLSCMVFVYKDWQPFNKCHLDRRLHGAQ